MITRQTATGRSPVSFPNSAEFEASLTNSVIPRAGFGAVTYTRATPATVQDNEGIIRYARSGETRFQGARRVENLLSYSEAITNASWIKTNAVIALDTQTIQNIPVYSFTNDATNGVHSLNKSSSYSLVAGNKYIISCIAKAGTSQYIQLMASTIGSTEYVNFDLSTGSATAGNISQSSSVNLGNGFYRISLSITAITSGVFGAYYLNINSPTSNRYSTYVGGGEYIYITAMQMEDVTGQSIQTVGEYVSTNVLSSPFHGAMVDGVKYFDTDISGIKITPDGYLAEGGRTNLFINSEAFDLWSKVGGGVVTSNVAISPDGKMTADLFTLGTTTESQALTRSITTSATIYGDSIYVKPNGHYYIQIASATVISNGHVNFDLLNGVVGTTSNSWTGRIETLPNGWYRIKVTTNTVSAATDLFIYRPVPAANSARNASVAGDGSSGIYLWGAQLEVGASSSYIPTAGATVARNDDILEYNLVNLESKQGTVYAETTQYFTSTNTSILGLTGSSCRIIGSSGTAPGFYYGSGTQVISNDGSTNLTSSNSVSSTQINRVIWKYSGVAHELCVNGTLTSGVFDGTTSYTNLCVGNATANSRGLYGSIRNLKIWRSEITDAEAVALTTL